MANRCWLCWYCHARTTRLNAHDDIVSAPPAAPRICISPLFSPLLKERIKWQKKKKNLANAGAYNDNDGPECLIEPCVKVRGACERYSRLEKGKRKKNPKSARKQRQSVKIPSKWYIQWRNNTHTRIEGISLSLFLFFFIISPNSKNLSNTFFSSLWLVLFIFIFFFFIIYLPPPFFSSQNLSLHGTKFMIMIVCRDLSWILPPRHGPLDLTKKEKEKRTNERTNVFL